MKILLRINSLIPMIGFMILTKIENCTSLSWKTGNYLGLLISFSLKVFIYKCKRIKSFLYHTVLPLKILLTRIYSRLIYRLNKPSNFRWFDLSSEQNSFNFKTIKTHSKFSLTVKKSIHFRSSNISQRLTIIQSSCLLINTMTEISKC